MYRIVKSFYCTPETNITPMLIILEKKKKETKQDINPISNVYKMLIIVTALGGEIENGLYFNFNFFYFLDSKHGDLVYFSL